MEHNTQKLDMKITAKSLFFYSVPTILTLLFFSIYTMIGGVFVARLVNTNALSAINIILPLSNIPCAIGMMLATGGSAIVARTMGEGDYKKARGIFTALFVTAFLCGAVLGVIGLIFINPIITFLGGSDPAIFEYCMDYAKITLYMFPFGVTAMLMLVFVITAGRAAVGTILALIGGLGTIALDYVLIDLLEMGVVGAALAANSGYALPSLLGFALFLFDRKGTLYWCSPKITGRQLLESCTNGSSEMVTNLSVSAVTLLFNLVLMKYSGADGVASITIILYAQGLLNSAFMGYSTGIAPIISFNHGKGDTDRLKKIFKISLRLIIVSSVAVFALSGIVSKPIASVFAENNSAVYELTIHGFELFSFCFLFMGINIFASSMFTALSNGRISALISFMRSFILASGCILLLSAVLGLEGVWWSIPLAELLGLVLSIFCFIRYKDRYEYY